MTDLVAVILTVNPGTPTRRGIGLGMVLGWLLAMVGWGALFVLVVVGLSNRA